MMQLSCYEDIKTFLVEEKEVREGYRIELFKEQTELEPDVKKEMLQWVKDLESGDYRQSREMLYDEQEDGYCCLGVAMLQANINRNEIATAGVPSDLRVERGIQLTEKDAGKLVRDMIAKVPDECTNPWYTSTLENTLTSFNDDYFLTFEEIAMLLKYKFKLYE